MYAHTLLGSRSLVCASLPMGTTWQLERYRLTVYSLIGSSWTVVCEMCTQRPSPVLVCLFVLTVWLQISTYSHTYNNACAYMYIVLYMYTKTIITCVYSVSVHSHCFTANIRILSILTQRPSSPAFIVCLFILTVSLQISVYSRSCTCVHVHKTIHVHTCIYMLTCVHWLYSVCLWSDMDKGIWLLLAALTTIDKKCFASVRQKCPSYCEIVSLSSTCIYMYLQVSVGLVPTSIASFQYCTLKS